MPAPRRTRDRSRQYLTVRLTDRERTLLQIAARLVPCDVSAYVREAVMERMVRDLRSTEQGAYAREVEEMLERMVRDG